MQIQAAVGELPARLSCRAPTGGSFLEEPSRNAALEASYRKGPPAPGSVSTEGLGDSKQLPGPAKAFAGHLGLSAAICQLPLSHQHLSGAAHVAKQLPGQPSTSGHPTCTHTAPAADTHLEGLS